MRLRPAFNPAVALAVGVIGLALLAVNLLQPAPSIRVRWRADITAARQAELERRYGLTDPAAPLPEAPRSLAYRLLDTRRANIEALVMDPDVADTNDIDRERFTAGGYRGPGARAAAAVWRTARLDDGRVVALAALVLTALVVFGLRAGASVSARSPDPVGPPAVVPGHGGGIQSALIKLLTLAFVVIAARPPILERWEAMLLMAAGIAIGYGGARVGWRWPALAAALLLACAGGERLLPRADVAEAHNAFMVMGPGGALEQGLPPDVYRSWAAQFDALYPAVPPPYVPYSWRAHDSVPRSLFAPSADAIWRPAKYSRQVDDIAFTSLPEFRGGFTNDLRYNFWAGTPAREALPFYAMYELSPAAVGSRLVWAGQVFWERADGGFDEIVHVREAAREIVQADSGRRVYAVFFPQRDPHRVFRLEPSASLRRGAAGRGVLVMLGVVGIVALMIQCRWAPTLRALAIVGSAYALLAWPTDAFLGPAYPAHSGGGDGLFHESTGREMALIAGRGEIVHALQGVEPVYWFTPGTRYVRMAEKLLFGETNLLFGLLLALLPLTLFTLCRPLLGAAKAWAVTALFLILPFGSFSYREYVANGRIGYGEALGAGLFVAGLALLVSTLPPWRGWARSVPRATLAGAALAGAMFIRPNFALAVAWCGAACAWYCIRTRNIALLAALSGGLSLALWMPFHNWFYGGEFHLISGSRELATPLGPGDYLTAFQQAVAGATGSPAAARVSRQLTGWLGRTDVAGQSWHVLLAWVMHTVRLIALGVAVWVAACWLTRRRGVAAESGIIATTALWLHVPMLFVFSPDARYAMLAWDLSVIALILHLWSNPGPVVMAAS